MAFNEDTSFIEYPVDQPTQDFVTNFDTIGGTTDVVLVTVDGVLTDTPESSYTVQQINHTTWRVTPEVQTGSVVRLYRVTNIDEMMHVFTAGAKFIARNMDSNFKQIRHAQQEVRDGFSKLATDTGAVIDGLDEVLGLAQDAAQDAQDAAVIAQEAADTVNAIIVDGKVVANNVLDESGKTQQELNNISLWGFSTISALQSDSTLNTTNSPVGSVVKVASVADYIVTDDLEINKTAGGVKLKQSSERVPLKAFKKSGQDYIQALSNALATADENTIITLDPRESYVFDAGLTINRDFILDAQGAELKYSSSATAADMFYIDLQMTGLSTVTNISIVNVLFDNSSVGTPCHKLTFASSAPILSLVNSGDVIKIADDQIIPWSRPDDKEYLGQHAVVHSKDSTSITLVGLLVLPFSTTNNMRVAKLSDKKIDIRNLNFTLQSTSVSRNRPMMYVRGAIRPQVHNIYGHDAKNPIVQLLNCYAPNVKAEGFNLSTNESKQEYGYVVAAYGCTDGYYDVRGEQVRHAWTSGAQESAAGAVSIHQHGGSVRETVKFWGQNNHAPTVSTHPEAYLTTCYGVSNNTILGENSTPAALHSRGKAMTATLETNNPVALHVELHGNSGDHNFTINHRKTHTFGGSYSEPIIRHRGIDLTGLTANRDNKSTIKLTTQSTGDCMPILAALRSTVDISINGWHSATASGANRVDVINALEDATVYVSECSIDYSKRAAGLVSNTFARIGKGSKVTTSVNCNVKLGSIDSSEYYFPLSAEADSDSSTSAVINLSSDVKLTRPNITGSPSFVSVLLAQNGQPLSTKAEILTNATAGGVLDVRNARRLVLDESLTANKAYTLNSVAMPVGEVFEFVRTANSTGAFTWDIGSGLASLSTGQSVRVCWTGLNWIKL